MEHAAHRHHRTRRSSLILHAPAGHGISKVPVSPPRHAEAYQLDQSSISFGSRERSFRRVRYAAMMQDTGPERWQWNHRPDAMARHSKPDGDNGQDDLAAGLLGLKSPASAP
ncbi:hypothetical protein TARUN_4734 [Trichoderma arundinaceum]|uniref:Uncharacterized protein n=1 Tax=Trichoderma arundinaceum TaxID=490622 RepID=A0A395NN65_TRIAR|nr:hypothetical protein TARUN_4734 [Trichoderma arundinaceum]